jgi:hypothetical protein
MGGVIALRCQIGHDGQGTRTDCPKSTIAGDRWLRERGMQSTAGQLRECVRRQVQPWTDGNGRMGTERGEWDRGRGGWWMAMAARAPMRGCDARNSPAQVRSRSAPTFAARARRAAARGRPSRVSAGGGLPGTRAARGAGPGPRAQRAGPRRSQTWATLRPVMRAGLTARARGVACARVPGRDRPPRRARSAAGTPARRARHRRSALSVAGSPSRDQPQRGIRRKTGSLSRRCAWRAAQAPSSQGAIRVAHIPSPRGAAGAMRSRDPSSTSARTAPRDRSAPAASTACETRSSSSYSSGTPSTPSASAHSLTPRRP